MIRFDEQYREAAVLRDGSRVTLRLVRPDDRALLKRGFERLSPESRYRRFLVTKGELSDAELTYLTEVDGRDHFAMGAVVEDPLGREEGVGIGRFIRSATEPTVAEAAVAVVDDWQGKGLGTLLLLRLVSAARERGIERFAGQVLASNDAIRAVLAQFPTVSSHADGDELAVRVDLPEVQFDQSPKPEDRETPLRRLLALVTRDFFRVRNAMQRLTGAAPDQPSRRDASRGQLPARAGGEVEGPSRIATTSSSLTGRKSR